MVKKPTYEELEQRVDGLEKKARERARLDNRMQLLSLAVEQSSEGIAVVDLDGNLEYLNVAFARMHGYSVKELIGKNLSILHTPQQMPSVEAANRQIKKTGNFKGEIWHVTRNGTEFPTLMHNSLLRDDTGNPIGIIGTLRDITDLKGKEAEIKASEVRFRELFNYMSSGVAVYEAKDNGNDFIFKDFNRAGERIENVKKENLLGKSVLEMFPGVKEFGLFDVFKRVWETGTPEHHPVSLYKDDRITGWRENYIYKLPSGKIVAVYDDVTEHKLAEEKLQESEKKYRDIFENAPVGIFQSTPAGRYLGANREFARTIGFDKPEELTQTVTNIADLYVDPRDREEVKKLLQEHGSLNGHEIHLKNRMMGTSWMSIYVRAMRNETEQVEYYDGFTIDITERKLAEEALRKSEEKYRLLAENASDVIWTRDMNLNLTYLSPSIEELTGYSVEESIALPNSERMTPASMELMTKIFEEELKLEAQGDADPSRVRTIEIEIICKDGSTVWVEVIVKFIRNEMGQAVGMLGISRDITDRKQAEEALRESEERLRTAGKAAYDLIYEWDVAIDALEWFGDVDGLLGHRKGEISRDINAWLDLIHPEDRAKLKNAVELHRTSTEPIKYEYRVRHNDGTYRHWNDHGLPLLDDKGCPYKWVGVCTDITQLMKMQSALKEANDIINRSPVVAFLWKNDEGWPVEFVSENVKELFGYSVEDFTSGKVSYEAVVHPDDIERVTKEVSNFSKDVRTKVFVHKPYRIITKSRTVKYVDDRTYIRRDNKGEITHYEGVVIDITDRVQAVEALREGEEKYRSMMEAMKDAAYISSSECQIEYINPAMMDRIGRDTSGKLCHKAIYNRDEKCSWCVFDQVQQKEHVEYEMADPKDNRYYSVTSSPISHTDGTVSKLTIFHDITEIKTIEENLRQAQKMESIGTLTGGIAHDFNNILGIIVGNTELALNDVPEWNPVHSNLEEIKTASLRATKIVKQLLSFSRKTDQKLQPIEIALVIKDALKFMRSTIPTTIDIQQDIQATDETILADATQINQIMMNLCINASQAMEQTGGNLTVNVEKVILDDDSAKDYPDLRSGKHVKVTVSDTGPGMDPEIIDRIFDPYFTTKEVGKGSGMGLAVVQGIVANHNGTICVYSEPGKGTTFSILFPVATEKPEIEKDTAEELLLGSETVLFVDDEKSIVKVVRKVLERLGYQVKTALTPQDALAQFSADPKHFDLVITDMTMPKMTGVMLSEKILAIRPDIPVIICTGHSALIDEERAKQLGIAAYVMKPIIMTEIAKTIRKVLDKK